MNHHLNPFYANLCGPAPLHGAIARPMRPSKSWLAAIAHHVELDGECVDLMLVSEVGSDRCIALEPRATLGVDDLLGILDRLEQNHDLPLIIFTRGELLTHPAVQRWAIVRNITLSAESTESVPAQRHELDLRPLVTTMAFPDLGWAVAATGPTQAMYYFDLRLNHVSRIDEQNFAASCVHIWGERPHLVHFQFSREILHEILEGLPIVGQYDPMDPACDGSTSPHGLLPLPIILKVVECYLPRCRIQAGGRSVAFEISNVVVKPVRTGKVRHARRA